MARKNAMDSVLAFVEIFHREAGIPFDIYAGHLWLGKDDSNRASVLVLVFADADYDQIPDAPSFRIGDGQRIHGGSGFKGEVWGYIVRRSTFAARIDVPRPTGRSCWWATERLEIEFVCRYDG